MCRVDVNGSRCSLPAAEVHHIDPKGMGGRHGIAKEMIESDSNLMCICMGHHKFHAGIKCWRQEEL